MTEKGEIMNYEIYEPYGKLGEKVIRNEKSLQKCISGCQGPAGSEEEN